MNRRTKRLKRREKLLAKKNRVVLQERAKQVVPNLTKVLQGTSDGVSMSDVMWKFVEPYLDEAPTYNACRMLIQTAMIAWNLSLVPEDERPERFDQILLALPPQSRSYGRQFILELIERKHEYFLHNKRMMIDFELEDNGPEHWHLSVVSLPPKEDK